MITSCITFVIQVKLYKITFNGTFLSSKNGYFALMEDKEMSLRMLKNGWNPSNKSVQISGYKKKIEDQSGWA